MHAPREWVRSAPMELLAVLVFFVALGLGAFFLAMSGGPRGARERRERERRKGVKVATAAFLVALLVLGIVIPLTVFAGDKNRDSYPSDNIRQLTALQKHGQELFGQQCR